jgi:hypothetical protein
VFASKRRRAALSVFASKRRPAALSVFTGKVVVMTAPVSRAAGYPSAVVR